MSDIILYDSFIESKRIKSEWHGFEPTGLPVQLFDFQKDLVTWGCKKGRAAFFADTGLGKSFMQIAWADQVAKHTSGLVLIIAPLCVAHQTIKEGAKLGINIQYCRHQSEIKITTGIVITNYERLILERMANSANDPPNKYAIAIVAEHYTPSDQDVILSDAIVRDYWRNGKWEKPLIPNTTVMQEIRRMGAYVEKKQGRALYQRTTQSRLFVPPVSRVSLPA